MSLNLLELKLWVRLVQMKCSYVSNYVKVSHWNRSHPCMDDNHVIQLFLRPYIENIIGSFKGVENPNCLLFLANWGLFKCLYVTH